MTELHSWQHLIDRYLDGTCSKEELEELLRRMAEHEDMATLDDVLKDHWARMGKEVSATGEDRSTGKGPRDDRWEALYADMMREAATDTKPIRTKRIYWAAAAVLLLALGMAGYRWYARQANPAVVAQGREPGSRFENDVPPGSSGAVLTLAGGQKIVLDSAGNRLLAVQSGTKLTNRNGQIVYEGKANPEGKLNPDAIFNTLSTSKGKQYQLVLSDGSRVWLNAASSIRYPAAFPGKARSVEITGEAYFEIAPDPLRPFTVRVNGVQVNVLGTRFDINAYADEPAVRTTLLAGVVQVSAGGTEKRLKPGEQAQTDKEGHTNVLAKADADGVIGWKEGYFSFDNTDLATIMREIARWYDVDVVYEGPVPDRTFGGEISRNSNASQVLKILEESNVYFKIEGRKIIVMP
jgi:ferric-dicitrate binding protein FerR (iron transport regulator)